MFMARWMSLSVRPARGSIRKNVLYGVSRLWLFSMAAMSSGISVRPYSTAASKSAFFHSAVFPPPIISSYRLYPSPIIAALCSLSVSSLRLRLPIFLSFSSFDRLSSSISFLYLSVSRSISPSRFLLRFIFLR